MGSLYELIGPLVLPDSLTLVLGDLTYSYIFMETRVIPATISLSDDDGSVAFIKGLEVSKIRIRCFLVDSATHLGSNCRLVISKNTSSTKYCVGI